MSDITALNRTADSLGRAVSFWNAAIIVFLALTAVAAAGLFIAQRVAFKRADELATVQAGIASIKEGNDNARILALTQAAFKAAEQEKQVELQLSAQQEKTANAERRLLLLQTSLRPRGLTSEQRMRLVALLTASIKGELLLRDVNSDDESRTFTRQLESVLKEAGWTTALEDADVMSSNPRGIEILVSDIIKPPPRAQALKEALASEGFDAPYKQLTDPPSGDLVRLFVGVKP